MTFSATTRVFPACAGMFPLPDWVPPAPPSFPRMRGDVPDFTRRGYRLYLFSPHARGCSLLALALRTLPRVFPACAGMFLPGYLKKDGQYRFPRMRGDVPSNAVTVWQKSWFSRMRGDVPLHYTSRGVRFTFSPHARGCSFGYIIDTRSHDVFPACAGMFLAHIEYAYYLASFPRMRGDVPMSVCVSVCITPFSPHARGCSWNALRPPWIVSVFPACAGMFRCAI